MKKNYYPLLLSIIAFLIILLGHQHVTQQNFIAENCIDDECMHIVWNDDEESIPVVGSLVEVEFIDAGCVYIGPVN
jgi:uncharacterized membrane protein